MMRVRRPAVQGSERHDRTAPRSVSAAMLALALTAAACTPQDDTLRADGTSTGTAAFDDAGGLLGALIADRSAPSADRVEVWVCSVPLDTRAATYGTASLRVALTPAAVVDAIAEDLRAGFAAMSFGRYDLRLQPGGVVALGPDDDDQDCADRAVAGASAAADTVLAIADAEHVATAPGGWSRPGTWHDCDPAVTGACSARATGRVVYVGANDFAPARGPEPWLDLIEHELGHTLGLPHSGIVVGQPTSLGTQLVYSSALDVMSNSAAPREVDPARREGPDTIGINRLDLGWLDPDDVAVVDTASSGPVTLEVLAATSPVQAAPGAPRTPRLVAIPLDDERLVTVEYLVASGRNRHLPESGVAVHVVSTSPLDRAGPRMARNQRPIGSSAPHTDLLGAGDELRTADWVDDRGRVVRRPGGWTIRVVDIVDGTARLEITATDR